MSEKEKQLLLINLCARLPYDTIISVNDGKYRKDVKLHPHYIFDWDAERWDAKPYLRSMSTMTEEEIKEWDSICVMMRNMPIESIPMVLKFVNSKHLDYNNLIPKDLALEAPEGMYNFK